MNKEKIYVLIKNFSGLNQDVEILESFKEAKMAFRKYTDFPFNKYYLNPGSKHYNEKFSETKIYELELPYFLDFRKQI